MPKFVNDPVDSTSDSGEAPAVVGEGVAHAGVRGTSRNAHPGVHGHNDFAPDDTGHGGNGGWFESAQGEGVRGQANNPHHGGVVGVNTAGGFGVYGLSRDGHGVVGESSQHAGVFGRGPIGGRFEGGGVAAVDAYGELAEAVRAVNANARATIVAANTHAPDDTGNGGNGGWFESAQGEGLRGTAHNRHHGGVVGVNTAGGDAVHGLSERGTGVVGLSHSHVGVLGRGPIAGHFDGNVVVTGDIQLAGADLAEQFEVVGELAAEPGCVVVLAGDDQVRVSERPYDHRVAGVVSGAGGYRPAMVLDRRADAARRPLALTGKVWCRADADDCPIEIGDLLTTSATPGHAMRAGDPGRAFGAVIGKALGGLARGRGLIPVLVALQ